MKMVKKGTVMMALFVIGVWGMPANAVEVTGVNVREKMSLPGTNAELVLNGAGIRTKLFF